MTPVTITAQAHSQTSDNKQVVLGGRLRIPHEDTRLCLACGSRRARFSYRGVVKADRAHTLCFECFRAERNRLQARRLMGGGWLAPLAGPRPTPARDVADRESLYADLRQRRRRAQMMARYALELVSDALAVPAQLDAAC